MPMEFPHEVIDYDGVVLELNMRLIIPMKTSVSVIMTHIMSRRTSSVSCTAEQLPATAVPATAARRSHPQTIQMLHCDLGNRF